MKLILIVIHVCDIAEIQYHFLFKFRLYCNVFYDEKTNRFSF